jgi:hypothetical protein
VSAEPGYSFVKERHDSRARDVASSQPLDPEARICKQIIDLSAQVASPREAQPERIETLLPARHARLRSAPMLHEQQTLSQQPSAGHAGGNLLEHLHPFPELALGEKQKTFNLQKIGKINRT